MHDEGAIILSKGLQFLTNLQQLFIDLSNNSIGSEGVTHLGFAIGGLLDLENLSIDLS